MKTMGKNWLIIIVCLFMLTSFASIAHAEDVKGGLFVNLTTDDTWAATKAIMFAHQKVLKTGHKPVAVWLNVRAIYLGDKKRASHVHGLMKEKFIFVLAMMGNLILMVLLLADLLLVLFRLLDEVGAFSSDEFIVTVTADQRIVSLGTIECDLAGKRTGVQQVVAVAAG